MGQLAGGPCMGTVRVQQRGKRVCSGAGVQILRNTNAPAAVQSASKQHTARIVQLT